MLVISLQIRAVHLPEKIHCKFAFSPILALGLFFQIAFEVTVLMFSNQNIKQKRLNNICIPVRLLKLMKWKLNKKSKTLYNKILGLYN